MGYLSASWNQNLMVTQGNTLRATYLHNQGPVYVVMCTINFIIANASGLPIYLQGPDGLQQSHVPFIIPKIMDISSI